VPDEKRPTLRIALALAALYVIWGTTYYVIRATVRDVPPLSMAALRFLAPGLVLLAVSVARHGWPTVAHWRRGAVVGILMLTIGNGAVTYGETRMPSGLAALLVTAVPMWAVGLDWVFTRKRPSASVLAGLALGAAGVAVLVSRDTGGWTGGFDPRIALLIPVGSACWALGSLRSRRKDAPDFWTDLAVQMLAGGAALAVAGGALGEWPHLHWAGLRPALPGILYLSVFGSVVALGCFLWLLRVTTPAVATTYAFVNPAVAVVLAMSLGDQPFSAVVLGATALVIAGVALIVSGRRAPKAEVRALAEPE